MRNKKETEKREFLIKGLLFLVGMLVCLEFLSLLTYPKDNTKKSGAYNYQAKGIYSEEKKSVDVIAIGASNFWCGYIPMQIWKNEGYTSYNCGTLMQHIWYTYYFLQKIYKTQQPKVVLIDADVFFIEDSTTLQNVNDMIRNTLYWKLPVVEYHDRWKSLSRHDFSGKVHYTFDNEMKGFYYVNYKQPYILKNYMHQRLNNQEVTVLDRIFMSKIIKLCKSHGTKIVLVEAPTESSWNYIRHNAIAAYAKEKKMDFIDANYQNIGIDWNIDSRDGGYHLNYSGAQKFTTFVEDYLKKNTKLTDHRLDSNYSNWNTDLAKFQNEVNPK